MPRPFFFWFNKYITIHYNIVLPREKKNIVNKLAHLFNLLELAVPLLEKNNRKCNGFNGYTVNCIGFNGNYNSVYWYVMILLVGC